MGEPLPRGLVYTSDAAPGIRRLRRGSGFVYRDARGAWLRDRAEIGRIRRLAIPPAYGDVWICPDARGHLQATGRDARGRKQYRYHPEFRAFREDTKFSSLAAFGKALPRIRSRVAAALDRAGRGPPTRDVVLATIVRLLDTTFVRVGNDEYARDNGSFGLTTLRARHAEVRGEVLRLGFRGKSGREHRVAVDDPRVARVVRRCQALPGQELFRFVDEDGDSRAVGSGDVNDWLEAATGERFTAKHFRTWHGSVLALESMRRSGATIKTVCAEVAERLGNTPAVCRRSYIHPKVIELAGSPQAIDALAAGSGRRRARLGAAECRLMDLLVPPRTRRR